MDLILQDRVDAHVWAGNGFAGLRADVQCPLRGGILLGVDETEGNTFDYVNSGLCGRARV
jgi:hypothetical protein